MRPQYLVLAACAAVVSCQTSTDSFTESDGKRPSDWHFVQRTYPFYKSDPTAYPDALELIKSRKSQKRQAVGTWIPEGPTNIGGRIVDIEFDPLRPDTVYAAAATGGVLKSIDSGITWTPVFDDQTILTMGDIGIDPVDSDIIYAGTGEANGGHNNFAGGGIYKSTDAGVTWNYSGLLETTSIGRVIVDPVNNDRVFVAAAGSYFDTDPNRGVYRSDDAGAIWENILFVNDSTGVIDIAQKPDDNNVLLASAWERVRRPDGPVYLHGNSSGIYRTEDGGDTWTELGPANGLPVPLKDNTGRNLVGRIGISFSKSSPSTVYALYTDGLSYSGLYRSFDAGLTWNDADPSKQLTAMVGPFPFSWYFGQVRVHPSDPATIFAMDVSIARTEDGANNWLIAGGTHVDHHALAFDPRDPDRIINGNDGGIAISTSGGSSWIPIDNLPITQFYEINFDPTNTQRLIGGTQDNGTLLSNGGPEWDHILGGDGFYSIINPDNPNIIYAETQNGDLRRSTNGGNSFSLVLNGIDPTEKTNWSTPVVMDPNNSSTLYYGTDKIYRTTDGATSWSAISHELGRSDSTSRLGTVTTIAVAPTDSEVIYAGTDDGKVWVTQDSGDTWSDITGGLPLRWVTRIAVSAYDPSTAFVTFSGLKWRDAQPHIFRTRDAGATWEDISSDLPDLPINALALDDVNPNVVYIGTDIGAFVTEDNGASWDILGDGLPAVSVYDLKYIASTKEIIAGTHGRSAYRLDVRTLSVGVDDTPIRTSPDKLKMYPNPFRTNLTIELPSSPSPFDVSIYDILGRKVLTAGNLSGGELKLSAADLKTGLSSSGVYLVRITQTSQPDRVVAEGSLLYVR